MVCLFPKQVVVKRYFSGTVYFSDVNCMIVMSLIQTSLSGVLPLFQKDNCSKGNVLSMHNSSPYAEYVIL